jgi:ABC-type oligopeptide transport system ATPase subunit
MSRAVEQVSLEIRAREVITLISESSYGKTTLSIALLRLESATAGCIYFGSQDIKRFKSAVLRQISSPYLGRFSSPRLQASTHICQD